MIFNERILFYKRENMGESVCEINTLAAVHLHWNLFEI